MKRNIKWIVVVAALFAATTAPQSANAQNWNWAKRHGGDSVETVGGWNSMSPPFQDRLQGWNSVVDLAADPQNNIYAVSLVLSKYLDINTTPLAGFGKSDILLSSYTCDGVLRWSKVIGSNQDSDVVIGVRCSELGVFVSGMTTSNLATGSTGCHFSTDTVIGSTPKNIFLSKWDFNGNFQWLRMPQPDTISAQSARSSALVDMDANFVGDTMYLFCYLTPGSYAGGQYNVPSKGAYVLKYTGTGSFAGCVPLAYQKLFDFPNSELYASRWSYNGPQNQFVAIGRSTVTLQKGLDVGGTQLGRGSAYLASFNASTGGLNFLLRDTNAYTTQLLRKVAIDPKGDLYVSGNANQNALFNSQTFPNSLANVSPAYPYSTGYAPFVMKINGKTGTLIWTSKSQATSALGLNVCLRKRELLLSGEYSGTLSFSTTSVSNNPAVDSGDAFTAYLDTATGALLRISSLKAKTPVPLIFNSIILDRKGSFICSGNFNDTLKLNSAILVETHPSNATKGRAKLFDAWIGKLGYNNCNCSVSASYKVVSNYGTTSYVAYTGSTNIDSLVWSWGDGTKSTYKNNFTATISHAYAGNGRYQVCVTAYNDTCSDSQFCGTLPLAIGSSGLKEVSVHPNPTTEDLFIEGLPRGSASIVSVTGQTMMQIFNLSEKQVISVGHLPAGFYMILLQDETRQSTQRQFIKQ